MLCKMAYKLFNLVKESRLPPPPSRTLERLNHRRAGTVMRVYVKSCEISLARSSPPPSGLLLPILSLIYSSPGPDTHT